MRIACHRHLIVNVNVAGKRSTTKPHLDPPLLDPFLNHLNMVHDYNLLPGINHEGREPFPKSYERVARSVF